MLPPTKPTRRPRPRTRRCAVDAAIDAQSEPIDLATWLAPIIEPEARRLGYRGQLHVVAPGPLIATVVAPALRRLSLN